MTADLQARPAASGAAAEPDHGRADRRRRLRRLRRLRRTLLLAGLLPLLLAVLFAGKAGTMLWADHAGRADDRSAAYDGARGWFGWNRHVDVLERWVAPYDEGTARIRLADFPAAVDDLDAALAVVPATQECRVRINLSIAHEGVGDDLAGRGDLTAARAQWQAGVTTLARGGCRRVAGDADPEPLLDAALGAGPGARSAAEAATATQVDTRLRGKLDQALTAAQAQASQKPTDSADTPAGQLAERNQRGVRQQVRNEQHRQDLQDAQLATSPDPTDGASAGAGAGATYHW